MTRAAAWVAMALTGLAVPLPGQRQSGGHRSLAPRFAGGGVWVSPRVVPPAVMDRRSPQQRVDSTVQAITSDYLRARDATERARAAAIPEWTATLAGQTVGLDSRYVHLGPVRLPTVLLGLLPIPGAQVNPQQWDRQRTWALMRADIARAGARQAHLAELTESAAALRKEREAKRAFAAAQRRPPPPSEDQP